jgi:apolipoprotein D and lipocalin family protein
MLILAGLGVAAGFVIGGCTNSDNPPLALAPQVDLDRYAGKWYIIANIPYFAEKGNVASYFDISFNGDKVVDVYNARKGDFSAPISQYTLSGYVVPGTGNARWRESPFWPLYLSYLILYVDPEYRTALVGYPGKSYGWVLSRDATMDEPTYRSLLERFQAQGYDISRFARVQQLPEQVGQPGFQ